MKKELLKSYVIALFAVLGLFFITSCDEEDTITLEEQQERDDIIIKDFLSINNITNYQRTNSGLYHIPITAGSGESPTIADSVIVEYTGRFLSGKKFDSSRLTDEPFSFIIGRGEVISGWEEALLLMKVGGTSRFIVPSRLAYGTNGRNSIPGNSVLDFDIELISFEASTFSNGN